MSYGPYAKGLSMQDGYKSQCLLIVKAAPDVLEVSSNKYQNWELFDPEKWVPEGYILVRVDSRGAGRSPGQLEVWSPREAKDIAACVEWCGTQTWSSGKVAIHGISYYSMNQWQAAHHKPKHLAALCIWEGSSDYYRELARHGGILSDFLSSWYPRQVTAVQHGVGDLFDPLQAQDIVSRSACPVLGAGTPTSSRDSNSSSTCSHVGRPRRRLYRSS